MIIQNCPICKGKVGASERYPNYVCKECSLNVTDKSGRLLEFSNVDMSGGYQARYIDTKENYNSHVCYIDDVECRADEHRFGGIVIEKIV